MVYLGWWCIAHAALDLVLIHPLLSIVFSVLFKQLDCLHGGWTQHIHQKGFTCFWCINKDENSFDTVYCVNIWVLFNCLWTLYK
mmetsp:Transcript_22310/g.47023  ORF Transcript_22310/g.47023 Transcript_22310/m.47023 type:complete len:84 (-) Transcript_22310:258-509(-)